MKNDEPGGAAGGTIRLSPRAVREVLDTIPDPEMPISIVDLGIVSAIQVDETGVVVEITPTFVGCPALDMIRDEIGRRLRAAGAASVIVRFVHAPPWSVDRISAAGRESLRQHGVSVPERATPGATVDSPLVPLTRSAAPTYSAAAETVACPHCGASPATLESPFGPTRCRMIYYCAACRNSFEHLRRV